MLLHRKQPPGRSRCLAFLKTESTDWVSAPAIVNKPSAKNGIRLCIDSRPLNTALKRYEYPIPTVDHLLTEISNAKVFTLADIKSAFWHVPCTR